MPWAAAADALALVSYGGKWSLASGSGDKAVRLWREGPAGWACARELLGHTDWVLALADLGAGKLLSGADDGAP